MKTMLFLLSLAMSSNVLANETLVVSVHQLNTDKATQGIGEVIGTITLEDTDKGLSLAVDLKGIAPGEHGFHVHENPACEYSEEEGEIIPGKKAGAHFDPKGAGEHLGPHQEGHLGDLPLLYANDSGVVQQVVIAPRLTIDKIKQRAFIIHEGGDNYSDDPAPLGGGGARIACGIIK